MDLRIVLAALVLGLAIVVVVVWRLRTRVASRERQLRRVGEEAGIVSSILGDTPIIGSRAVTDHLDELRVGFGFDAVAVLSRERGRWIIRASAGPRPPTTPDRADRVFYLEPGVVLAVVGRDVPPGELRLLEECAVHLRRTRSNGGRTTAIDASAEIDDGADEMRSALLTAVSQDLRTPLASIKAAATSLLSPDVEWSAESIQDLCHTIDEEADRLEGVVANLLDMSRLHTGAIAVSKRGTAIDEIVESAVAGLSSPGRVSVSVPRPLPLVDVDPVLIGHAVGNVVDNAVLWSGDDVGISASVEGDDLVLRIVDHGPGIPEEHRQAVLRPLQGLGDARGPGHGLGLGLAVASGLVEANGGSLEFEHTAGGGLTVAIALPIAACEVEMEEEQPNSGAASSG
jgi:two-component system, OmpR family, sensor histidine kinase KdpD